MYVHCPQIADNFKPGQFVHVRTSNSFTPFLRRPLSIGSGKKQSLRLIFVIKGEGTKLLSEVKVGEKLDILGPLGSCFLLPDPGVTSIIIGGGIGIVPLLALEQRIPKANKKHFLVGIKSKKQLPISEDEAFERKIEFSSENGDIGISGLVTDLLIKKLDQISGENIVLYACGPKPMLIAVKRICLKHRLLAQVSLEQNMGCGVGACQGCAVSTINKNYLLVCKDGPVFDIDEVDLS